MNIIINADDFGYSERHSSRILELLVSGHISSTTFLVNSPYSQEASAKVLKKFPQLVSKIGLHLNLIEFEPLNERLKSSPFCGADGNLRDIRKSHSRFIQLRYIKEISTEIDLQISRFQSLFGRLPTHLDSHGHTHVDPVVLMALFKSKIARELKTVRIARLYDFDPSYPISIPSLLKRGYKTGINYLMGRRFNTVDHFTNIKLTNGEFIKMENLRRMAEKCDSVEIMVHPYYKDESEFEFLFSGENPLKTPFSIIPFDKL